MVNEGGNSSGGMSVVTIKDLAKLAGVSYSTVSKALNDSTSISAATKARIREIAQSEGYQKNLAATHLASGRTRLVGVALVEVNNPTFSNLALHLHRAFRARGYHMILAVSLDEVEVLSRLRVEGLILWEDVMRTHPGVVSRIHSWKIPAFILGTDDVLEVPHMRFDRKAGILEAVRYLRSFGHDRIGIVGDSQEIKIRAFMEAMADLGLEEISGEYLFPSEPTWEGGYRALKYARRDRPLPTAFIGLNNLVTKGALRALLERGYAVPRDISLIGYDNLPDMQFAEVPITTVGPLLEDIAETAAAVMVSLIEKQTTETVVVIDPVLIARASVSECRPSADPEEGEKRVTVTEPAIEEVSTKFL